VKSRVLYALFLAYVAATAVHIGFVIAHEPFAFDAWNVAFKTQGKPISFARFFEFWRDEYTHSNPRIGQALTYFTYKLDWFAEIVTPLAYLAIATASTVLGIGRWPWRHARDLALWAIAIGFGWFVFPELGRNMFSRAYSANYVYAAAMILWFLVPLRMAKSYEVSPPAAFGYAVAGSIAGLCNEHTGPALLVGLFGFAWYRRRGGEKPRLLLAGGFGVLAGFLALFFSPGQAERYEGLASKVSIPMRVLRRGFHANLDIVGSYIEAAAPLLFLLVVLVVASIDREKLREPLRLVAIALVAGLVLTFTLFASPRLGSRFHYVSMALLRAGTLAVIDTVGERWRIALVSLAVESSIYATVRTVPLYMRVKRESDARLTQLANAKLRDAIIVDSFTQVDESWWFIGDDFRWQKKREMVAEYKGLAQIGFRDSNSQVPLGISGVLIAGIALDAANKPIDVPIDLDGLQPFDVPGIQRSIDRAIAHAVVEPPAKKYFEAYVHVPDGRLPRDRILLAKWRGSEVESYDAIIDRTGVSTERVVKLGKKLATQSFEIYAVQIGSDTKRLDGSLRFKPWRTGIYWILACDAAECWVVAVNRLHAL
jgi:hypothetical protein